MEIDAFLADSVVSADGKLYVQGGVWNQLTVGSFPARHPRLGLAIAITVPYSAVETHHQLEVRLEDEDGGRLPLSDGLAEITASFDVAPSSRVTEGDEQLAPVAINLDGLVFDRPGRFRFVISIDDVPRKHLPFTVVVAQR